MALKLNVIAAVCEGGGIGAKGALPWKLKGEMAHFKKITTTITPGNEGKKNVVIMGRKTWESIPKKFKPLSERVNVVISSTMESSRDEENEVLIFRSLPSALAALAVHPYIEFCADIWIIGGSSLYSESIRLPACHRLYITRILKSYDCDTFFPPIPDRFVSVEMDNIPKTKQTEDDVDYVFKVYESTST